MHMSFWFGVNFPDFLFKGYNISTWLGMFGTCVLILLVAFYFESIKIMQARLRQRELLSRVRQLKAICPTESEQILSRQSGQRPNTQPTRAYRIWQFVCDLFLWSNQTIVGYLLMLAFMTYNGYLAIAICFGAAIGFFIFGPALLKINVENCMALRETFCMKDCGEPGENSRHHVPCVPSNFSHIIKFEEMLELSTIRKPEIH